MECTSIPVTAIESVSIEIPLEQVAAAANLMVFKTSLADGISSGEAVSLNTSSPSIVVVSVVDELKHRLPA